MCVMRCRRYLSAFPHLTIITTIEVCSLDYWVSLVSQCNDITTVIIIIIIISVVVVGFVSTYKDDQQTLPC